MKRTKQLLLTAAVAFVMAALISSGLRRMQTRQADGLPAEQLPPAVVVYCFHGGQDETADKIMLMVRELADEKFDKQMKSGQMILQYVNFNEPENAFFVPQYRLAGPCVVIVDGRPGRSKSWKEFGRETVELAGDKAKFVEFFHRQIDAALK